jgi:hypothetical protein
MSTIPPPGLWTALATESLRAGDGSLLRQTRIAYDGQPWGAAPTRGSPTAVMRGLDGWGWVTTTMQYDAWGNAVATTDPLGRVTRTDYDPVYHQYPDLHHQPADADDADGVGPAAECPHRHHRRQRRGDPPHATTPSGV